MNIKTKAQALLGKISGIFFYFLLALIFFVLGILLFNNVIMPRYVQLGEEAVVPDVINLSSAEAKKLIESKDFKLRISKYDYDMVIPKGKVAAQNPIPGLKVKIGKTIRLTVSKGPEKIFVPDLSNVPLEQARLNLKSIDLDIGDITYIYDDNVEKEAVISNIPTPNTPVDRKTLINLIVSKGEKPKFIICPSFIGKALSEVRLEASRSGLAVGQIVYEDNSEFLPETVMKQSIAPGNEVFWGDTINLIVSN